MDGFYKKNPRDYLNTGNGALRAGKGGFFYGNSFFLLLLLYIWLN